MHNITKQIIKPAINPSVVESSRALFDVPKFCEGGTDGIGVGNRRDGCSTGTAVRGKLLSPTDSLEGASEVGINVVGSVEPSVGTGDGPVDRFGDGSSVPTGAAVGFLLGILLGA